MQLGSQLVAFVVDGLIGQEEVVIKPLDGLLQGTPGMLVQRLPVMVVLRSFWMCRACSMHTLRKVMNF